MVETQSNYFFSQNPVGEIALGCKPVLVLDQFSTPENIGHVIRLAANVGALKVVIIIGTSHRQSKIKKTAGVAYDHIPIEFVTVEEFMKHIPEAYELIALETADSATDVFSGQMPDKMALVLGNEKNGVSQDVLAMCKKILYIPMAGPVKSMNVSHAASVCLFHWYCQQQRHLK